MNSEEPLRVWVDVNELYMERYWKVEKNPQKYHDFLVRASDSGIPYAHSGAASYFNLIAKDYSEVERSLSMLYHSYPELPLHEVHCIVREINLLLSNGYELTNSLKEIIDGLKKRGHVIEQTSDGYFNIPKKK